MADPAPQSDSTVVVEPVEKEIPENPDVPELTPEPASPEPKARKPKRLTLQERLALAAKAKKKTASTPTEKASTEPEEPKDTEKSDEKPVEAPEIQENTEIKPENDQTEAIRLELEQTKQKLQQTIEENRQLRLSAASAANAAEFEKKLADKDVTIQQLMEEGETLSKKELKLNDRIKTLAQTNTKLEASLKAYSEKNEETLLKLGEIEDIMKVHKLKSVDQLLELLDTSNGRIQELQQLLDREKEQNWEAKYKELQRIYESELNEKKSYVKQLNDITLQLQMLQQQSKLDLQLKDDLISHLNQEIVELRDENSSEMARLESKIEGLRIENESFLRMSENGSETSAEHSEVSHKQIDYLEFAKLSETHRNLQAQYVSSQENWKLIELNLLSKVDTLLLSLDAIKKQKLKSANEVRKLNIQISSQSEQILALKQELAAAQDAQKELAFQLQVKNNEYAELEEKLEELKTVFNGDRQNYDIKIKTLNETIQKYEEQSQLTQHLVSSDNMASLQSRRLRDSGLHINLDLRNMPTRNFSLNSIHLATTPIQQWEDHNAAPFTPYGVSQLDFSSSLLTEELHPFDAPDSSTPDMLYNFKNETPTLPSSGGMKNIQLIQKMSSNIRRLEMELLNLKEENEHISAEKDTAQQEILGKYELEQKVAELQGAMEKLQEEVSARSKKEQTLLEVIGEKLERVAELQADVVDLKDLCRQQVQQMIEMAEK